MNLKLAQLLFSLNILIFYLWKDDQQAISQFPNSKISKLTYIRRHKPLQ